jgi:predicted nucleic acid-binding protein
MSDEQAQVFVDTNILVYAHDVDAGDKHRTAKERVSALWQRSMPPAISVQVLQELFNTLIKRDVPSAEAEATVSLYIKWEVIENDCHVLMQGIQMQRRWQLSPWDAWILAAAKRAGARTVWSEDLSVGQDYDGVTVVNPLVSSPPRRPS